ncbi:MAG: N-formylglutamate amidohydrolase [Pacificimonas sp.]
MPVVSQPPVDPPPFVVDKAPRNGVDGPSVPILLASPHSGLYEPANFRRTSITTTEDRRRAADFEVDRLFRAAALTHGLAMVRATHSRTYVDLNRDPAELDPAIIEDLPPRTFSARVRAGLGVIPRMATPGVPLYDRPIRMAEANARLGTIHRPYHAEIGRRLAALRNAHGSALLIDCHSMPSLPRRGGQPGAAFVVGDRHGESAMPRIGQEIAATLSSYGRVAMNDPYAGGHGTTHHGNPARGIHAVQIEIDRSLYLESDRLVCRPDLGGLPAVMTELIGKLAEQLMGEDTETVLAAE